jgi:hypothetical protein
LLFLSWTSPTKFQHHYEELQVFSNLKACLSYIYKDTNIQAFKLKNYMRSHIKNQITTNLYVIAYNFVYLPKIDAIAYNEDFS